jgi:hypothetical protein
MNFFAASHGVSMNDTFYPNPDKPELKIEYSIGFLQHVVRKKALRA